MPRRLPEPAHRLDDLAARVAPDLHIVSVSHPGPVFREHNLIAVTEHEDVARELVVALESDMDDDAGIGVVVLSAHSDAGPDHPEGHHGVDPERVTGQAARRIALGGSIGAVVGAVLIGGLTALFTAGMGPIVAAAVGAAFVGFVWGATYVTFAKLGGSDAYRQTFLPPEVVDVAFVSLHTDRPYVLERARERFADHHRDDGVRLVEVDRSGRPVDDPCN